jgi:hypothetical protein
MTDIRQKEFNELAAAHQRLWNTVDGQLILYDLKKKSNYFKSSIFDKTNINPNQVIYDEAQRSVILYIEKMMNIDLERNKDVVNT